MFVASLMAERRGLAPEYRRLGVVALCGSLGYVAAPALRARWTHGALFAGQPWVDRIAVARDLLLGVPVFLVAYLLSWRVLRSVGPIGLIIWSSCVGAYTSSIVYFDWFAIVDQAPGPKLLDGAMGAVLELAALATVPVLVALAIRWIGDTRARSAR